MKVLRDQRGQLMLPFIFVPLSLFLFVFLIFETAKLSREKIRHQFALDAAAFIEMTNYSDFLNRSAYVNGAFPQRIFEEGFKNTMIERKDSTQPDSLYDILYRDGDFPRTDQATPLDPYPLWNIKFGGNGTQKNLDPPDMSGLCGPGCLEILTLQDALDYWLSWDDALDIYRLYVQIYQLLGSVEDAQYSVFCRLTGAPGCPSASGGHNFFRKSYWLNTGDNVNAGQEGAQWFDAHRFNPRPYCVQQVMFFGNKPTNDPFEPYKQVSPQSPISMPSTIQNCLPSSGLFQVEAINPSELAQLGARTQVSDWPGYPVVQHWHAPGNFFNVLFEGQARCPRAGTGPCVHATIALINGLSGYWGGSGGHLWPNPTPKFQTRLYP